jgi:hypothetical protein
MLTQVLGRSYRFLALLLFVMLAVPLWAAQFTAPVTIDTGTLDYEGQDIVVDGCTVTINGAHSFNSLALIHNAVVTHSALNRLELTIANDVSIEAGSRIDLTGKGYQGTGSTGNGPGGGTGAQSDSAGGGGGAHAGNGGNPQSSFSGGQAYGSALQPADFGSAGGAGYAGVGGAGGGAIRLVVGGSLVVNGSILANGNDGLNNYYGASGGGAGGSIWITAGTLKGAGSIAASGGAGPIVYQEDGGGGGGGRIAVYAERGGFSGTVAAIGGTGYQAGGAGTVYVKPEDSLTVDNAGRAGAWSLWPQGEVFARLIISGKAGWQASGTNDWQAGELGLGEDSRLALRDGATLSVATLQVATNATLSCEGRNRSDRVEGVWAGSGITIQAGAMSIAAGGVVTADGRGYTGTATIGNGPSGGSGARTDSAGGAGGGYGGGGGWGQSSYGPGGVYGSASEPVDLGSAGGAGYGGVGGAGGGALRLAVDGTLTVDGVISANAVREPIVPTTMAPAAAAPAAAFGSQLEHCGEAVQSPPTAERACQCTRKTVAAAAGDASRFTTM